MKAIWDIFVYLCQEIEIEWHVDDELFWIIRKKLHFYVESYLDIDVKGQCFISYNIWVGDVLTPNNHRVRCWTLRWRHNGRVGVSNHQPHDCLLNRLFGRRSKKASKLRVTGLCAGNSPVTGEFPAEMASHMENVSIWWRHHEESCRLFLTCKCEIKS